MCTRSLSNWVEIVIVRPPYHKWINIAMVTHEMAWGPRIPSPRLSNCATYSNAELYKAFALLHLYCVGSLWWWNYISKYFFKICYVQYKCEIFFTLRSSSWMQYGILHLDLFLKLFYEHILWYFVLFGILYSFFDFLLAFCFILVFCKIWSRMHIT